MGRESGIQPAFALVPANASHVPDGGIRRRVKGSGGGHGSRYSAATPESYRFHKTPAKRESDREVGDAGS